jgi:DNA polymerase-4
MRERAGGIDERPVMSEWDEKSISAEETFFSDLADHARMRSEVMRLADRAGTRMRAQNLAAGCVQVKIRRGDFTTFTRQKRFEPSTTDSRTIAKIATELLDAWLAEQPRSKVRLLGVGVNHLHAADQMDLFAAPATQGGTAGANALDTAVDLIRERFGNLAVRRGSALPEARGMDESGEDMSEDAPGRRKVRKPPAAPTTGGPRR